MKERQHTTQFSVRTLRTISPRERLVASIFAINALGSVGTAAFPIEASGRYPASSLGPHLQIKKQKSLLTILTKNNEVNYIMSKMPNK